MNKIRRINLLGSSGIGKSTVAAFLYGELKTRHYNIELVQEAIKPWAYAGKLPSGFDQLLLFAKQVELEEQYLKHGVDYIITDSPLFLNACYALKYKTKSFAEALLDLVDEFEDVYPSYNIYLHPDKTVKFNSIGRYEKESTASAEMHYFLLDQINAYNVKIDLDTICTNKNTILSNLINHVNKQ